MTFSEIFTAFYTQYRADVDVPADTDDEWTIGLRLANEAVNRWANYDGMYWKELWTTHQIANTGDQTVTTGDTTYACSTTMREAGSNIQIKNSSGNVVREYPIIELHEKQFQGDMNQYAYFTGNPTAGFVLNLNPAPDSSISGMDIDFVFYKKPTEFSVGASTTEMANPYFIVHHMLANRFRASRNWSGYQTAKRDAESALGIMKMDNDSGSFANPWSVADHSGTTWGA